MGQRWSRPASSGAGGGGAGGGAAEEDVPGPRIDVFVLFEGERHCVSVPSAGAARHVVAAAARAAPGVAERNSTRRAAVSFAGRRLDPDEALADAGVGAEAEVELSFIADPDLSGDGPWPDVVGMLKDDAVDAFHRLRPDLNPTPHEHDQPMIQDLRFDRVWLIYDGEGRVVSSPARG